MAEWLVIKTRGIREAQQFINGVSKNAEDLSHALTRLGEEIKTEQLFRLEEGIPPALAESTRRQKQRRGQPMTPLIATGAMRDSIVIRANWFQLKVGPTAEYAKYHVSDAPRRFIPKRDFVSINPVRFGEILDELIGIDLMRGLAK